MVCEPLPGRTPDFMHCRTNTPATPSKVGKPMFRQHVGISENAGAQKSTFSVAPAARPVDIFCLRLPSSEKVPAGCVALSSLQKKLWPN